ncbi:hypothetical protein DES54_15914 [Brenneria salicis ATCC 15712 = DSM 30166]|uniref:LysE type translocator n=1 Tax=Brenneria salicis ATCC 15712 = DSM 30166 TaxID=714314 RepID=A0A366HYX9_9GAMM|nr:hypothetical protein DES54_15914 [Brenneria salicis ATCC 15712 = DSM 30166]
MPEINSLFAFSLIALGMVLTPGPNMIYTLFHVLFARGVLLD